jgi:hypothetical protein
VEASTNPPIVSVDSPASGDNLDGPVIPIEWTATDLDGEELSTTVLYSADDGASWDVLAINVAGTTFSAPTEFLAGSDTARIRLAVSDGFHTTTATSGRLTVRGGAPVVVIASPSTDVVHLDTGQPLSADAWGWDPVFGELTDDFFAWSSDLAGPIGEGASIDVHLEEGCHEVTVEATGGNERTSTATLMAEVGDADCQALPEPGTIIIERQTAGAPTAGFQTDIPGYSSFQLTEAGYLGIDGVAPGSYEIHQLQLPDGWSLASIECLDQDSTASTTTGAASIHLDPGEEVSCLFTDTDSPGTNQPPTAGDDEFSTDEDTPLEVDGPGVLDNDGDPDGDDLSATVETSTSSGTITLDPDGSFTYDPDPDFCGRDSFTYRVSDGALRSDPATTRIEITCVDDPPVITASPAAAQYSDRIDPVPVAVSDIDSPAESMTLVASNLPSTLSLDSFSCTAAGAGASCTGTITGIVDGSPGSYTATLTAGDATTEATEPLVVTVLPEDAAVRFHGGNPVAVPVETDTSGLFEVVVRVTERSSDTADGEPLPGDLQQADVSVILQPIGPGGAIEAVAPCQRHLDGTGYDQELTVTCVFDDVPVDAYSVVATVGGAYAGAAEDVVVVYDPSSSYAQGGGTFVWPGTDDTVRVGFSMEYNKKGTNVKGGLMLVRTAPDGSTYVVKSNALYGLALSGPSEPTGWASFAGKATFDAPWLDEPEGNHEFVVYAEDGEADRFWIEVRDKDGTVIPESSLPRAGPDHAVPVVGDVVVPHAAGTGARVD